MPSSTIDLPPSDSPSLRLVHPTEEERFLTWELNGTSWKGPLTLSAYLRREVHLADQPFTRDGGITYWILVDTSSTASPRTILSSCESLRKRVLIAREDGEVKDGISHGIGSVFCDPRFRGMGYAGRMIKELGRMLDTWQQGEKRRTDFTVLYSDIGKKFYAKMGWKPFPSSHIALPPVHGEDMSSQPVSGTTPIWPKDLAELCRLDEKHLRAEMAKPVSGSTKVRVALIPDVQTIQWHHAREEFAGQELLGRIPEIKGAWVRCEDGHRVWGIWTRTFGNDEDGSTLNILRLMIEGEEKLGREDSQIQDNGNGLNPLSRDKIHAASLVLQAAQHEAAKWEMRDVQLWNPSCLSVLAVRELDTAAQVIDRDSESIASLRWHGPEIGAGIEVDWVRNEKYGWC